MYFLQAKEIRREFKNEFSKLTPISYKPKKHTENFKNKIFQPTSIFCRPKKHTDNGTMNASNIFLYFT